MPCRHGCRPVHGAYLLCRCGAALSCCCTDASGGRGGWLRGRRATTLSSRVPQPSIHLPQRLACLYADHVVGWGSALHCCGLIAFRVCVCARALQTYSASKLGVCATQHGSLLSGARCKRCVKSRPLARSFRTRMRILWMTPWLVRPTDVSWRCPRSWRPRMTGRRGVGFTCRSQAAPVEPRY